MRGVIRSTRHTVQRAARAATLGAALAAPFFVGCAGSNAPSISDAAYFGPKVRVIPQGDTWTAVVQSPSAGWQVSLDRTDKAYRHQQVFLTIRRPNPAYFHAQVLVDQHVATSVSRLNAIKVYARVLDHDAKADDDAGYTLAAESDASPPEPATTAPAAATVAPAEKALPNP